MEALRIMLCIAANCLETHEIAQFDIEGAYLNADLDRPLYSLPPEGIDPPDTEHSWCLAVKKAIYGFKQSGRLFNKLLDKALIESGFERLDTSHGIYFRDEEKGMRTYLLQYVDDLMVITPKGGTSAKLNKQLNEQTLSE